MNFKKITSITLSIIALFAIGFAQTIQPDINDPIQGNGIITPIKSDTKDALEPSLEQEEIQDANSNGVILIKSEDLKVPLPEINYPPEYYEMNKEKSSSNPQ